MELREWVAKWIAMVMENGEPYDDFDNFEFPPSYEMGEEIKGGTREAFLALADKLLAGIKERSPHE